MFDLGLVQEVAQLGLLGYMNNNQVPVQQSKALLTKAYSNG
jgi:hypothetical protein